jgi:hypothetical protein
MARAKMPSNSEDDPAEGAVLDQVTKGIGWPEARLVVWAFTRDGN